MSTLVLASASPRRRELLGLLGVLFEVLPSDVDERRRPGERPVAYVDRLAREKAGRGASLRPGAIVLAADTCVVCEDAILDKPGDDAEAGTAALRRLSGRSHTVLTGVAVSGPRGLGAVTVETMVSFRALSPGEIAWYVALGEGRDKAGGYGIQGHAGLFVKAISGSSSNVVGLPLAETVQLLAEAGLGLPWQARP